MDITPSALVLVSLCLHPPEEVLQLTILLQCALYKMRLAKWFPIVSQSEVHITTERPKDTISKRISKSVG